MSPPERGTERKKSYLLDTNVLLHDPEALFNFQENDVYLPLEVVVELDKFKKGSEERNVHAREACHRLEELTRESNLALKRDLAEGIPLTPQGGKLFFLTSSLPENVEKSAYFDDRIIYRAQRLREQHPDSDTCVVTKDVNLRIRLRLMGVRAEDYLFDKAVLDLNEFFNRQVKFETSAEVIDTFHKEGAVLPPGEIISRLEEGQYLILKNESQSALGRYHHGKILKLKYTGKAVEKVEPRNYSQRFLLDSCLDENTKIVAGLGKAGTGKTVLALAAGLCQVINEGQQRYKKIIIFRPTIESGKELGFLPGELEEKISPHFQPINTALRVIMGDAAVDYAGLGEWIDYRPINFVRGDTFHNQYIVVDEAQNFTPKEIKQIGTRLGENSKMVLIGDPFQIDNPYLDEKSNGLTVMTDRFRGKVPGFSYVILDRVERSKEAQIFADYL
ncbi:MAG: PhoH family protein [Nanoarchaeota archaeon]